jgi:hypothetical protein
MASFPQASPPTPSANLFSGLLKTENLFRRVMSHNEYRYYLQAENRATVNALLSHSK